jgi:hypothetical protein
MTQIEITIPAFQAKAFDEAFSRFLICEFGDGDDPLVQMDVVSLGECERRILWFESGYKADAFSRHWMVARRS